MKDRTCSVFMFLSCTTAPTAALSSGLETEPCTLRIALSFCAKPTDTQTRSSSYKPGNLVGYHICYISDLSKIYRHFPNWKLEYDLPRIIGEIVQAHRAK